MKKIDVVGAVIRNASNQILCAQRSPKMSLPNHWEFPGGKIKQGETPQEALVREIQEELGCKIEVYQLITETKYRYPESEVLLYTFETSIIKGTPKPKEHSEIRWVNSNDLLNLNWSPADLPTVDKLIETKV
ncbi:8-oxo-dGTP diphosphatase [Hazenella coriacea]|uniref:8-oxo-dGTP diphosphatase n=2 Tax=Hazenella coriacea TaxID=1179467 RepID=A0A4R3LC24_9BACL|nr:8-oxo-dGTP diphosphatase [Hazenella coriacea]